MICKAERTMGVLRMISVAKRTSPKTSGPNLTARVPDHILRALAAVCDNMGVTKTLALTRLIRWFCQLPRESQQLICGLHKNDEIAEIALKRLIESVEGGNRPDIADDSEIDIPKED